MVKGLFLKKANGYHGLVEEILKTFALANLIHWIVFYKT